MNYAVLARRLVVNSVFRWARNGAIVGCAIAALVGIMGWLSVYIGSQVTEPSQSDIIGTVLLGLLIILGTTLSGFVLGVLFRK